jgi:adenosylcobinamide-GDP ribazoletransferase
MSVSANLQRTRSGFLLSFLCAIQFLTRVPIPPQPYEADALSRAVKFFPLVGMLIGASAALLHFLLAPHLPRLLVALLVVAYLVYVTGCLHEDGLADAADGFGGGWNREQILTIMRDSRIGSYGAVALTLSLLARLLLISSLPLAHVAQYLVAAHVLCRWTTLPLSFYLPPARARNDDQVDQIGGQGARLAQLTTRGTLIAGTLFSFAIVAVILRRSALIPILTVIGSTLLSALYYKRRIGGVSGDCFGATNQLTEIVVYLCGVWTV